MEGEPPGTGGDVREWISVGRLLRPRGRVGELLAVFDSPHPDRAEALRTVRLKLAGRILDAGLERVWYHDGRPVLKFEGLDSISGAEAWAGAEIQVPASERVELEPGEYFHEDLIGCVVEAGGQRLGVVREVEEYGGPPVLKVAGEDGREVLIPFVRALCREIDVASKRIRAELPEGLTEL